MRVGVIQGAEQSASGAERSERAGSRRAVRMPATAPLGGALPPGGLAPQ